MALRVRKNQATLTPQEKQRFVAAVLELKRRGVYDTYVDQHATAGHHAHQHPGFLPWHREFLRRFELDLQGIDPNVTLPYWDWTVDNTPAASLWGADFLGGNGRPGDGKVMDGPFAHDTGNWVCRGLPRFLWRQFGVNAPALPTAAEVAACLQVTPYDNPDWDRDSSPSFRNQLEGWIGPGQIHNRIHVWVGGSMLPMTSPNDPVFFLHHCNVDRLWAEWQHAHPAEPYVPAAGAMSGHNLTDAMQPWGGITTVASTLDYRALGYTYDSLPEQPPPIGTPVRYGATLRLRHGATQAHLHSHPLVYNHPGTSGQQQVTCFDGSDDNDLWRIKGPDGQPDNFAAGQPVQHNDVIRLEHTATRKNLHSHAGFPSPLSGQQETTCFGAGGIGDGNDNWRIETEGVRVWQSGQTVRLIHIPTNHALHSHAGFEHPQRTAGQQEVTCFPSRDPNDLWLAVDLRARDARFVSQSAPPTMVAGQQYDVTVTMLNVGTETWTAASSPYRLGSQSPRDTTRWGLGRVDLSGPVAPGEQAIFAFRVTAPLTAGLAHFHWQMLQEAVGWFGEPTARLAVRIHDAAGPTVVPDVIGMARGPARSAIQAADLVPVFRGSAGARTEVLNQTPDAGSQVARGSEVRLTMTRLD